MSRLAQSIKLSSESHFEQHTAIRAENVSVVKTLYKYSIDHTHAPKAYIEVVGSLLTNNQKSDDLYIRFRKYM